MSNIHQFDFKGLPVSVIDRKNEVWFKAQDVCEAINLTNVSMALKLLDEDERSKFNLGRQGETNFISEPGLYHLLNGSRKPEARPFQRWVNHDVIPAIRKGESKVVPLSKDQALVTVLRTTADLVEDNQAIKIEQHEIRKLIIQVDEKVESQITLDHGEQRRMQRAVAHRVYELEPDDRQQQSKLFHEIYRELKDRFAVASYKDILRKELHDAIRYVEAFVPRRVA